MTADSVENFLFKSILSKGTVFLESNPNFMGQCPGKFSSYRQLTTRGPFLMSVLNGFITGFICVLWRWQSSLILIIELFVFCPLWPVRWCSSLLLDLWMHVHVTMSHLSYECTVSDTTVTSYNSSVYNWNKMFGMKLDLWLSVWGGGLSRLSR